MKHAGKGCRPRPFLKSLQLSSKSCLENLIMFKAMHEQQSARTEVACQLRTVELGIALNEAVLGFGVAFWTMRAHPLSRIQRRRPQSTSRLRAYNRP